MRRVFGLMLILIALGGGYYFSRELTAVKAKLVLIEKRLGGEILECDEQETVARVKASTVRVVAGEGEGSGVIVKPEGMVVTNFHVVQFDPYPEVVFADYSFEPAEVILASRDADLAFLKINGGELPYLAFDTSAEKQLLPLGQVYAYGFPLGMALPGEATVQKGAFVGLRSDGANSYLQIDISLNPGNSGGALTDGCGRLVGINTAGLAGLGMALSASSALETWFDLLDSDEPLADVEQFEFDPNESALEAVRAFYGYQKVRKLEEAYNLLADNFLQGGSFENWRVGYQPLIDTYLISLSEASGKENVIELKLETKELVGEEIVTKYFEGTWECRQENGVWKLWDPEIREVEEPDFEWFYGEIYEE